MLLAKGGVHMGTLCIIIPAYNEQENIINVINEWYPVIERVGEESKLVIIDDGSKDRTYEIAYELKKNRPMLEVITKKNSGHGATCLYGYNYAIENKAEFVFQTDSDGQTNAKEFWQFWDNRNKYDFIIGKRIDRQDGINRKIVTKILKMVILISFGCNIPDANTPYRLMNCKKLEIYIDKVPKDFFLSNVLLSVLFTKCHGKIKWLNITFKKRQGGKNSININKIFVIGVKAINEFRKFTINNKIFLEKNK